MKIFIPTGSEVVLGIGLILFLTLIIGYSLTRITKYILSIRLAWSYLLLATILVERMEQAQPSGFRMLSIILVMLFSMKSIVTIEYYRDKQNKLSFIQWLAFAVGWFGMKPGLFEELGGSRKEGSTNLFFFGISRIVIGSVLLYLANLLAVSYNGFYILMIIIGLSLAGISLILHFGILNVSAGMWRLLGADTRMLFRSPLLSTSLSEFWGRRWNIAFSEMTSIGIYRPLKKSLGVTKATLVAFLFSGLLHELAISVPVKAGLGLPLLYFLIHGLLMLVEKALEKKGLIIGKNKWIGRGWVLFWLLLPMPLLFHKYFLKGIILPFIYG
jgi:alginate O-acetyltransferase complex protein AlgI